MNKRLLFKIILRDWVYMREQGWLSEKGLKELREVEGYDEEELKQKVVGEDEV